MMMATTMAVLLGNGVSMGVAKTQDQNTHTHTHTRIKKTFKKKLSQEKVPLQLLLCPWS
jgi:hypothetical protein